MSASAISRGVPKCVPPFYSLKEVPAWHETIRPFLDPKVFQDCLALKQRTCEILLNREMTKALGLIVYKLDLEGGNTLVVRSFKVVDPKVNLEKGYQQSLLKRIVAIANDLQALNVLVDLTKESPLVDFIKSRQFEALPNSGSAYEKKYTHYSAKTAAIRLEAIAKQIKPEEDSRKRKRGAEEGPPRLKEYEKIRRDSPRPVALPPPPPAYPPTAPSTYRYQGVDQPRQSYGGRMNGTSADYGTSVNAQGVKIHKMPMKGTIYLQAIMDGIKKFEGRVNGPMYKKFHIGDELRLFDGKAGWGIRCRVTALDAYSSFRDMLTAKSVVAMLPQMKDKAAYLSQEKLLEEGVRVYNSFPGSQRVQREGCVAIGVQFLEKIYVR